MPPPQANKALFRDYQPPLRHWGLLLDSHQIERCSKSSITNLHQIVSRFHVENGNSFLFAKGHLGFFRANHKWERVISRKSRTPHFRGLFFPMKFLAITITLVAWIHFFLGRSSPVDSKPPLIAGGKI